MQSTIVMAFRKRLKKRGYIDISIRKIKDSENYMISANEPLFGISISGEYSIIAMHNAFRF